MFICIPTRSIALRGMQFANESQCSSSAICCYLRERCSGIRSYAGVHVGLRLAKFYPQHRGKRQVFGTGRDFNGWDGGTRRRATFNSQGEVGGGTNMSVEEWTRKLPAKRKALYSHSLPCIEAWLHSMGFVQGKEERAVWTIERTDWHAQLTLDVTDLYIRYLKKGPGNLGRDIERKFSYALSREDLENAILGGP